MAVSIHWGPILWSYHLGSILVPLIVANGRLPNLAGGQQIPNPGQIQKVDMPSGFVTQRVQVPKISGLWSNSQQWYGLWNQSPQMLGTWILWVIYTIGVLVSRNGGFTVWILRTSGSRVIRGHPPNANNPNKHQYRPQ